MFKVQGFFYELAHLKFRKYLDIQRCGADLSKPDVMVVMMNPGASFPLNKLGNSISLSEAKPDKTQHQIMAVMNNARFDYARVLNLSDLRTPKSKELYSFLNSEDSQSIPHSIFHPSRKLELLDLFHKDIPVIYAWGVHPSLKAYATKAISTLSEKNPFGKRKVSNDWAYYHPLPPSHLKQVEWLSLISSQFAEVASARRT